MPGDLLEGGIDLGDVVWEAWTPQEVAHRLAGVEAPWYVAAGWALDLFRGGQTREHEDLEIAVPAGELDGVRTALAGYELDVVGGPGDGSGRRWPLDSPAASVLHQTWVREPGTNVYRLDIFREPHDGRTWICRRDETIRLPYERIIRRTPGGIPYLSPEIVLLFKAKHSHRERDRRDFAAVAALLRPEERAWLRQALGRVHAGHEWLGALRDD